MANFTAEDKLQAVERYLKWRNYYLYIGSRPAYSLVSNMLVKAFACLPDNHQLLMQSYRGWHHQMKRYLHSLQDRGITQSMSRKGKCYDNSVMENFFGILKNKAFYFPIIVDL